MTISLNSITLNLEAWQLKLDEKFKRVWLNNHGDELTLNFFPVVPDLPQGNMDIHSIRQFYRATVTQSNGAIVEVETDTIKKLLVIKIILKYPMKSGGFGYLASYTLPREQFSFVIKIICLERGMTGMRETVILEKLLTQGVIKDLQTKEGWFSDPYDPKFKAPLLSNISDKAIYDEQFPNHPLTRARNALKVIKEKIIFSEDLVHSPKFF